jgi:hypothetical protein
MKALLSALLGLVPSLTLAALCDDVFNLQSVNQTLMVGNNPASLAKTTKSVSPNLSNLDIISPSMHYKIITRFDGSCTKAPKPVVIRQKAAGKTEFTDSTDAGYQIQMFDSTAQVENYKYDFWFGFYQPADALVAYLGRVNSKSEAFINHYAMVSYVDSTRNPTSGLWTVNSGYVGPSGPADSATLHNRLLEVTQRKDVVQGADRKIKFTVQMVEVRYENKPAPVSLAASKRKASGFQATRTGNLVLIQPGGNSTRAGESLSLYGMLGNKIAVLHPTGYMYQWNGRTSAGAEAPTGVYFVQSGSRILGKFFYAR